MATFNRAHLIGVSLQSIANQNYGDWECLIIDDGSKDNTKTVAQQYENLDSRFKYLPRPKKYKTGLPGCRNYGLDQAKGKYIIFFDDDDLAHPQNLEICLRLIENLEIDFVNYQKEAFYYEPPKFEQISSDTFSITEFGTKEVSAFITGKKAMASCTVMWDKACFESIRFTEDLQYAEEWECYSRILLNGFSGISINEILYFNRKHSNSNTGEFNMGNQIRKNSMSKAAIQVIENLSRYNKIDNELEKFFIRLGFQTKDYNIIKKTLEAKKSNFADVIKYKLGYTFYPIIKPFFKLKGKIKNG